jgi:hypothetical protein
VAAHRWWIGGRGKAPGKQDGSIDHLGEGRGGREDRSPWQTEAVVERLTTTAVLRWSTVAKVRDDGGEDEHRRASGGQIEAQK